VPIARRDHQVALRLEDFDGSGALLAKTGPT
jgi:hypothetical protein